MAPVFLRMRGVNIILKKGPFQPGSGMRKSIAADAMIIFTMAVGTVLEIHGAFPLKNPTQIEKHALIAIIRRFNYVYYRER